MPDFGAIAEKVTAHRRLPSVERRREIRRQAGLTQADIAKALDVRRVTVTRWETGHREPRGKLLSDYVQLLAFLEGEAS